MLAIKIAGYDSMLDGDCVALKIDCAPLQPQHLTPAQAIKGTEEYWNLKQSSLGSFKKFFYIITIIETSHKGVLLEAFNLICRIAVQ